VRLWAPLAALGTLIAAALVPASVGAATQNALPLTSFGVMVVDSAHQHVFVTVGPSSNGVVVRDATGAAVTTITNEPGATGLALSADGSTLWVALRGSTAISLIDTTTLTEKGRIALPTNACPSTLTLQGSSLWFGYACSTWQGGVGLVTVDNNKGSSVVTGLATGFYQAPTILASPNLPTRLIISGDYGLSPSTITAYDIGGSPSAPTLTKGPQTQVGSNLSDMALTPDATHVITASGSPYYHPAWKTSDLSQDGVYSTTNYPNSVTVSTTGLVVAGVNGAYSPDIYLFKTDGTALGNLELGATLAPSGLALSGDGSTLYAVAQNASNAYVLEVFPNIGLAQTALTATGPTSVTQGQSVTVTGSLTSGSAGVGAAQLTVTRQLSNSASLTLPSVTTASDGSYSFTDSPPSTGTAVYSISFGGDATHGASSATTSVTVNPPPPAATTMSLSAPASGIVGQALQLTAVLSSASGAVSGRTVTFTQTPAGGQPSVVATATTDSSGSASVSVTPKAAGTIQYTAQFAGDTAYAPSSASANVSVRVTTTLTLTAPATAKRGSSISLSGTLSTAGGPVAGASIQITRQDPSGTAVVATVTTGSNGSFTISDTPRTVGSAVYTATFAGTSQAVGSSASATVKVSNSGK